MGKHPFTLCQLLPYAWLIFLTTIVWPTTALAQTRQVITLAEGWTIKPITNPDRNAPVTQVCLPHTWNANYIEGTHQYNREMMIYERKLEVSPEMVGRRLFLLFEGANSVATVFVNRRTVGEHKGGYTAFCLEITEAVHEGENDLEVWVSNAYRTDVLPISGDFNVYGGLHRPVSLIIAAPDCIDPTFYASPGVLLHQRAVSQAQADIAVETLLSLTGPNDGLTLRATAFDAVGQVVAMAEQAVSGERTTVPLSITKPTLWQGRDNPYLYKVVVELVRDGQTIDCVSQPLGLRTIAVDPETGFFLNGRSYDLHGFNRHDDFKGRGSALTEAEYRTDMDLVNEAGATMLRLAHYPQGETIYNLCDSAGVVLWTEIPLCGPGGYNFTGYLKDVEDNGRQVMRELLYQKYNHPSICFWGIFNEILVNDGIFREYDNPLAFVRELHEICHEVDSTRLTTFATCVDQAHYLGCTDLIAWNKYFGWQTAEESAAQFFDAAKASSGGQPVGVSEYGAGANPTRHVDPVNYDKYKRTGYAEEVQSLCHEGYWKAFVERPYLWEKTIWQFSDCQSAIRNEGDTPGENNKGMVTYDRKTRKDAFYFYKANWNAEPMVYICSRRYTERCYAQTSVRVYTNQPEATLYINGTKVSKLKSDELCRIEWTGITLQPGENVITVKAGRGGNALEDTCTWTLVE